MARRPGGRETWHRLEAWDEGSAKAERLAGLILRAEGFNDVDPSHPLGGPDKLKDIICKRDGRQWRAAAWFPRGAKTFPEIAKKFTHDLGEAAIANDDGFIFVCNQELTLGQRENLSALTKDPHLYHLERVASVLNSPSMYGVRLEFLDIEMTKEEQLSFFAEIQRTSNELASAAKSLKEWLSSGTFLDQLKTSVPLTELREFSHLLETIAGQGQFRLGMFGIGMGGPATVHDLRVPLEALREFNLLLRSIVYGDGITLISAPIRSLQVPLETLREFSTLLNEICGRSGLGQYLIGSPGSQHKATVHDLRVPITELREFLTMLDIALEKARELRHSLPGKL
jgi:hypothetical protein